jgi:hypothetical protein
VVECRAIELCRLDEGGEIAQRARCIRNRDAVDDDEILFRQMAALVRDHAVVLASMVSMERDLDDFLPSRKTLEPCCSPERRCRVTTACKTSGMQFLPPGLLPSREPIDRGVHAHEDVGRDAILELSS